MRGEDGSAVVRMFGDASMRDAIAAVQAQENGPTWRDVYASWQDGVDQYWEEAQEYLLYE